MRENMMQIIRETEPGELAEKVSLQYMRVFLKEYYNYAGFSEFDKLIPDGKTPREIRETFLEIAESIRSKAA